MRKKFIYFALIPAIIFCVVVYIFLDSWVESGLEAAGEAAVGAKVEIDGLHVSFSPIGMELKRLQVANPNDTWKNIFETRRIKFGLDFGQLLRGKFIIETMEVNDLVLGTKRTTDGALPKKPVEKPKASEGPSLSDQVTDFAKAKAKDMPVFDMGKLRKQLNYDSLLDVKNLKSLQMYDSLTKQVAEAGKQWQASLDDLEKAKAKLAEIQKNIQSINTSELKSVESIMAAANTVNTAYASVNEVTKTISDRTSSVSTQVNTLTASFGKVDDVIKEDYKRVVGLAKLPDLSMKGLSRLIIGDEVMREINGYLYYVDYARSNIPKYMPKPDPTKPVRMKGVNIHFPEERSYPKFWIKKMLISGGTDKKQDEDYLWAKGEVKNITNDQRLTGMPLTVDLQAQKASVGSYQLFASFDRRTDESLDIYKASAKGLAVRAIPLGNADFLPSKIPQAALAVNAEARVPSNGFDANVKMDFSGIAIAFERNPANDVERLVRKVLESVNAFDAQLRMWKPENGSLDVAFATNLDDQLSDAAKRVVGEELARLQAEIKAKVDAAIAEKRKMAEKYLNEQKAIVMARIEGYKKMVNDQIAQVEAKKKEIEKKIEDEKNKQTDAAKKKLEEEKKKLEEEAKRRIKLPKF